MASRGFAPRRSSSQCRLAQPLPDCAKKQRLDSSCLETLSQAFLSSVFPRSTEGRRRPLAVLVYLGETGLIDPGNLLDKPRLGRTHHSIQGCLRAMDDFGVAAVAPTSAEFRDLIFDITALQAVSPIDGSPTNSPRLAAAEARASQSCSGGHRSS